MTTANLGSTARRTAYRLAPPVALLLAALTLLLPFVTFRIESPARPGEPASRVELTYTGLAPVLDGPAQIAVATRAEGGDWEQESVGQDRLLDRVSVATRVSALLAVLVLLAGAAAAALRTTRARALATVAAALLAAATLTGSALGTRAALSRFADEFAGPVGDARPEVALRYGFWLALGLLAAAALVAAASALSGRAGGAAPADATPADATPADATPADAAPAGGAATAEAGPAREPGGPEPTA